MSEADILPERVRMRADDRRAAVIEEAIRIIGERGYQSFSVNELAKRCGLTTAGLLHHFKSKEGLLIALLEERDRRDREAVSGRLGMARGERLTRSQVLTVFHSIVRQNANQPHLVRLFVILRAEALVQDHPARRFFEERERETSALFAMMLTPHVDDAETTARQVQAVIYGMEVQWLRDDCGFDLVAEWDKVADRLIR